jgi:hypothetical protein
MVWPEQVWFVKRKRQIYAPKPTKQKGHIHGN